MSTLAAPPPAEIRASVRIVYLGPVAPHWRSSTSAVTVASSRSSASA